MDEEAESALMAASQAKLLIGNDGTYKLTKELLGRGSFSKVYKGYIVSQESQRTVAIKKILMSKIKLNKHLQGEIDIMKRLSHPNIVNLVDIVEKGDHMYLILEYCECGDLKHFLKKRPLRESAAKYLTKQLAQGLQYLRNKNIVHRDLKPQNILITRNKVGKKILKIADFGFARILGSESLAETMLGSPLYMAPEIVKSKRYTDKADLWSTGIILYEMLYGKHPFNRVTGIYELMKRIENSPIHFPSCIRISAPCKDLLCRLLQKEPKHRIEWEKFFRHLWLRKSFNQSASKRLLKEPKQVPPKRDALMMALMTDYGYSDKPNIVYSQTDDDIVYTIRAAKKPLKVTSMDTGSTGSTVIDPGSTGSTVIDLESTVIDLESTVIDPGSIGSTFSPEIKSVEIVKPSPLGLGKDRPKIPKSNPIYFGDSSDAKKTEDDDDLDDINTPVSTNSPPFLTIIDDYYDNSTSFSKNMVAFSEPALLRKKYAKVSEEESRDSFGRKNSGSGSSSISQKIRGYMSISYDLIRESLRGFH